MKRLTEAERTRQGYTVRVGDIRHAEALLHHRSQPGPTHGDLYDALRTLVGFAETIPTVNVAEADAAVAYARQTAEEDSNDNEIAALQDAIESLIILLAELGVTIHEPEDT